MDVPVSGLYFQEGEGHYGSDINVHEPWYVYVFAFADFFHDFLSCLTLEGSWVQDSMVRCPVGVSMWRWGGLNVCCWHSDCHGLTMEDTKLGLERCGE